MDYELVTADCMREEANNATILIKRISKLIRDNAREGMVRLDYCIESISEKAAIDLITALNRCGFGTTLYTYNPDTSDREVIKKIDSDLHDVNIVISW